MSAVEVVSADGYLWCVPSWWNRACYIPLTAHEADEVSSLRRLFPDPEKTFIDVGANTGFYSIKLAAHFARVVAFEPDSENAALLAVNAALNHCENVSVLPLAAWQKLAPVSLLIMNPGIPMRSRAHWTVHEESDAPDPFEHDRQDHLIGLPIDAMPTVAVGLIKIDVEGCGDKVLRGAEATITRDRPLIQMEVHNEGERDALRSLLGPLGYQRIESQSEERERWAVLS